jgi:hypothetical protein
VALICPRYMLEAGGNICQNTNHLFLILGEIFFLIFYLLMLSYDLGFKTG